MELLYVFAQVMFFVAPWSLHHYCSFQFFSQQHVFILLRPYYFCNLDCFDDLPIMLNSFFIRFMRSCSYEYSAFLMICCFTNWIKVFMHSCSLIMISQFMSLFKKIMAIERMYQYNNVFIAWGAHAWLSELSFMTLFMPCKKSHISCPCQPDTRKLVRNWVLCIKHL